MSYVPEVLRRLHMLEVHPLAMVIIAALLAALIEQRMTRHRTADFSAVFRGGDGPPLEPPPKSMRPLGSGKKR